MASLSWCPSRSLWEPLQVPLEPLRPSYLKYHICQDPDLTSALSDPASWLRQHPFPHALHPAKMALLAKSSEHPKLLVLPWRMTSSGAPCNCGDGISSVHPPECVFSPA